MKIGIIGAGACAILASCFAAGVSVTVHECPEPIQEPDYSKLAALPDIPEAELYTPMSDYSQPRILNQRQKRKLKRQQPHGRV